MYLYTTQGMIGVQDQDFVCNYLNNGIINVFVHNNARYDWCTTSRLCVQLFE